MLILCLPVLLLLQAVQERSELQTDVARLDNELRQHGEGRARLSQVFYGTVSLSIVRVRGERSG